MRVVRVRLFALRQPLRHSFETSSHRKSGIEHVLVEVTDADGQTGWGEIASPSDPFYGAETTVTAWEIATRYLVPALLRADGDEPAALEASWARVRGHEFAKAGFSGAVWDLSSRMRGGSRSPRPWAGRATRSSPGCRWGSSRRSTSCSPRSSCSARPGYPRVKLKIAPGWDVEPVRAVRGAFPDLDLHVDAKRRLRG
ncbi:hypothetical protein AB1285_17580 [Microbacterium sp. NRRL B-14842]|uniref:hypothetical protein n=1 Tax=Microbacterium sp. NRRL B-14842 TaxID=3162881 RepID=UPI003D2C9F0A